MVGGIHDIRGISEEVHKIEGAMVCVDGVALAPHREVDVKELGCDFYSFSWYKVWGPPPSKFASALLAISTSLCTFRLPLHYLFI